MLKTGYSRTSNNTIRKRIPRNNNTVTKNDRLYLKSDTKFTGFNSDIYHSAVTQPETQSALNKQ